jgi:hypothetical protein
MPGGHNFARRFPFARRLAVTQRILRDVEIFSSLRNPQKTLQFPHEMTSSILADGWESLPSIGTISNQVLFVCFEETALFLEQPQEQTAMSATLTGAECDIIQRFVDDRIRVARLWSLRKSSGLRL